MASNLSVSLFALPVLGHPLHCGLQQLARMRMSACLLDCWSIRPVLSLSLSLCSRNVIAVLTTVLYAETL